MPSYVGSPSIELRYLSRGERGRLQVDRRGAKSFDVIFAGDQALVPDHAQRRYRAHDLNTVKPYSEPAVDVDVERTTDRRELSGLLCYPWRLRSGSQTIDACVRGLPGPVDTDKLETLSGMNLPPGSRSCCRTNTCRSPRQSPKRGKNATSSR